MKYYKSVEFFINFQNGKPRSAQMQSPSIEAFLDRSLKHLWEHSELHQPFQSRESPKSCRDLQSYNSPGDWARELSKPSTDSASLVFKIENKRFLFSVGGFLEVSSQRRHVLEILATFSRPWAPTHWPTLLSQSLF